MSPNGAPAPTDKTGPQISRDELLGRARALAPGLRERAPRCEEARRMLDETVRDLHDAGLFRFLQSSRVGGLEMDFDTMVDLPAELARGCPSTAWNVANIAAHHFMIPFWDARAQDEVWGPSPDTLVAASIAFPAGRGKRVDGGYVISGRWPYASGVDHCDWCMLAATIREADDGPPVDHRLCLVPRADYQIIDNWYAAGLRGTGSKDVAATDLFVPEHRALCMYDIKGGDHPGSALHPGALFRVPLIALAPFCTGGVALGNALSALDGFIGATRKRKTTYTAQSMASFQAVQIRTADAGAKLEAAQLMMGECCKEAMRIARDGGAPSLEAKLRYRRNGAFAVRLCTEAVLEIFAMSGAGALYETSPMQRALRDAHAIAAHINHNIDVNFSNYGLHVLGGDYDNPMM
ncbi:MAG TPA: acyl-CoA dehydrogenase family protein [Candidatus Sulfotelmatobacter sp.]|nr:acyl-CoA dehydrogenase family protein [Candidatus Sulfotelmatobacter sp.]